MGRYSAFISYSHADTAASARLQRAIETYRIPKALIGQAGPHGPVPARLKPAFRDRDELAAAGDLGAELRAALSESDFQIVVCSERAARSEWVNREVLAFKAMHGETRTLALICSGEPGDPQHECFPPALRFKVGRDERLTSDPAEPVAADSRPGKDGSRLAQLKLIAAIAGLRLDQLVRRDEARRRRRLTLIASASGATALVTAGLAFYADVQRREAVTQRQIAERESAAAISAADFLINTFTLANPATENPRTITALTILDRGARRARSELADQPGLQARLIGTLSSAYSGLGLLDQAELVITSARGVIDRAGVDGVYPLIRLADVHLQRDDTKTALAIIDQAKRRLAAAPDADPRLGALADVVAGRAYARDLDIARGTAAFDSAIAGYRRSPTSRRGDVAGPLLDKGMLLTANQQFAAADRTLLTALSIARSQLGDQHRVTGTIWNALAENALQQGAYAEADRRSQQALRVLQPLLEGNNTMLADAILMRGQIELSRKRYTEAAAMFGKAIAIYAAAFRKPHQMTGIAEVYLALAKGGEGDLAGSLAAFDRARANYDAVYGQEHANQGDLLVNRATMLAKFGQRDAASRDCRDGLGILARTLGPDASYTRTMTETCRGLGLPAT